MGESTDEQRQDPLQYWGYLFQKNKCATPKLDRLLRGIAACISANIHRHDSNDLTPTQLATFYRSVGGDYDPLFLHMPAQSIAFIYKSLGCLHSIQPNPQDDGYTAPSIPALKPAGFVTWQTIQLLLGPHEHIPFMQRALQIYDVRDPRDGKPFPKILPNEAFPSRPDAHMVAWHAGVSERLRIEAQEAASVDNRGQRYSRTSSTDLSTDEGDDNPTDSRADAAQYFSNPFNKDPDGRPAIVRAITKALPSSMVTGGLLVGNTVRHMASPFLWGGGNRRRASSSSSSEREREKEKGSRSHRYSNESADSNSTPTENGRPSPSKRDREREREHRKHSGHHHHEHSKHSHSPRRNGRASNSSSNDPDSPVFQRHSPKVRRHKSYDGPPQSPREYFGAYDGYHGPAPNSLPKESQYFSPQQQQKPPQQQQKQQYDPRIPSRDDHRERNGDRSRSHPRHANAGNNNRTPPPQTSQGQSQSSPPILPTGVFGPSESPPFAVKVAHIQQQQNGSGGGGGAGCSQDRRARFNDDPTNMTRRFEGQGQGQAPPPPKQQQTASSSSVPPNPNANISKQASQRQNPQPQPQYRNPVPQAPQTTRPQPQQEKQQQKQWNPQAPAYAYARTPSYQQNRHPQQHAQSRFQPQSQPMNGGSQNLQSQFQLQGHGPGLWSQGLWTPATATAAGVGGRGSAGVNPLHPINGTTNGIGGDGPNGTAHIKLVVVNGVGVGGRQYPGF